MAIFTPGPLIGAITGNLASLNFVQGRHGPYVRKRMAPTRTASEKQLARRARFQFIVSEWKNLPAAFRAAWNAAAQHIKYTNRLGLPTGLSGFQFYLRFNLAQVPLVEIWNFPPQVLMRMPSPENVVLTSSAGGDIVVTWDQVAFPTYGFAYFYGARNLCFQPTHHFKNWRWLWTVLKTPGAMNFTLTAKWDPELGHPLEGELISVRIALMHREWLFSFYVEVQTITLP